MSMWWLVGTLAHTNDNKIQLMGYEGCILTQNTILYLTSFVPRYSQKQVMQVKMNVGKADVLESNLLVAGKCLQIQILLGFIFPPHMRNIHRRSICMCQNMLVMGYEKKWFLSKPQLHKHMKCTRFLIQLSKIHLLLFWDLFFQISLYNKTEKLICHCLWLQGHSPEVPLVVGDSVSRAVWCWRFQNHDFHLLRSVATGTGHQALPDSSNGHIDAGENNLAGGREKTRKTMKMCF